MEKRKWFRLFWMMAFLPILWVAACRDVGNKNDEVAHQQHTYTCPMHPQIVQNEPGTCPICGMDLVPFEKNSTELALKLNESQQALANISTTVVGLNGISNFKQLNGRLVVNPEKSSYISSRVAGRIEALYVKETGIPVQKGQPLYKIYSEQLATLQKEYLLSREQIEQFPDDQVFKQLYESAKQKLELYGESARQIKQLENAKKTDPYVTYYATASGTVAELAVTEGQYVSEGSSIVRLEAYNSLWVEADIYPAEAALVKEGQKVKVIVAGWENEPQEIAISFTNPSFQSGSQVLQIRGAIANPNRQWQPGLQANILLPSGTSTSAFSLPTHAVIRDGKGAHVWLETAKGKFVIQ